MNALTSGVITVINGAQIIIITIDGRRDTAYRAITSFNSAKIVISTS
jgi:hypothetical protein